MNAFELSILWWIREHLTNPFLDTVMPYISSLARHGEFWILVALILVCFKKTRKAGVAMGIAMAAGYLIGNMGMKNLFARTRPYDVTEVQLLVAKLHDFSFPSGHTLVSFEAATALWFYHRKWGVAAFVLAALIGLSRLYLFVHYPTDVLAGAVLGIGIGLAACFVTNRLFGNSKAYKIKE
ncbi:MAG: phosphatase PAP2 family protein [Clostridia bacterium]|nr:phosphatase PAP2 family protein [Clostridia bacterium]